MIRRNQFMKRKFNLILLALALLMPGVALLGPTGCKNPRLEVGGPYSPTNSAPDVALYQVDSAYLLAYNVLDTAFTIERNNRQLLWDLSPDIKKTLDTIRPEAVRVRNDFHTARTAYVKSPSTAGMTILEQILASVQKLASAAQAVIATKQSAPTTPTI